MNNTTHPMSRRTLAGIVVIASIVGALLFGVGQWLVDELTEPESITGISESVGDTEASLLDAVHEAAQEAVEIDGGKYKGDTFKIVSVEMTTSNPHVTAYKVVIRPTG